MSTFNFASLLSVFARVAPILAEEFGPKAVAVTTAGTRLATDAMSAVTARGSPSSIQAVVTDAVQTGKAAGLSSGDQANLAAAGSTIAAYAPVAEALATAGLPDHAAAITQAAGILQAVTDGVAAANTPAG